MNSVAISIYFSVCCCGFLAAEYVIFSGVLNFKIQEFPHLQMVVWIKESTSVEMPVERALIDSVCGKYRLVPQKNQSENFGCIVTLVHVQKITPQTYAVSIILVEVHRDANY